MWENGIPTNLMKMIPNAFMWSRMRKGGTDGDTPTVNKNGLHFVNVQFAPKVSYAFFISFLNEKINI